MNPGTDRRSDRKRGKRLLLVLLALGITSTAIGSGTFAAWTATTSNPNNQFSTGTVTMTNVAGSVISGTNCASATTNGTCATLFGAANASNMKPGGTDVTNSATITYTGSVTTGDFRLYAANYSSKAAGSAASCTIANPGSLVDLQVQLNNAAKTSVYPTQNTTLSGALASGTAYTTLAVAALPSAVASGTSLTLWNGTSSQTVTTSAAAAAGATSIAVTSFTANAAYAAGTQLLNGSSLYGTLDGFATAYTSAATGLKLNGGVNGTGAAGTWVTNDNSVFDINVHLDSSSPNTDEGCQSQSDLIWYASQ